MLRPQVGRLLRKVLVLAVLLTSFAVMNNESGVRKVAAQATCCQMCAGYANACINSCSFSQCVDACLNRYRMCISQCSPPCS